MRSNTSLVIALTTASLLMGCQSTSQPVSKNPTPVELKPPKAVVVPKPKKVIKPAMEQVLYLRGVFTWWDAEEQYKVIKVGPHLYQATAKLVADGEYYDFKFADKKWSKGFNCGYLDQSTDEYVVEDGAAVKANCSSNGSYFRFKPKQTGVFGFYFDYSNKAPQVYIKRL